MSKLETPEKFPGWNDFETFAVVTRSLKKEEDFQGDILMIKMKDEKEQWYFASSFSNTQNKGFIHVNCVTLLGVKEEKKEMKKKDPVKPGELLLANKNMVKKHNSIPWWKFILEDPLAKELVQNCADICKIVFKEQFEKDEETQFRVLEVLRKTFVDLRLILKEKDPKTRSLVQARISKGLEELGCDLTLVKTKGKDKGKVADDTNTTPIEYYRAHWDRQNIVEKSAKEQRKRIAQKMLQSGIGVTETKDERGFGLFRRKQEQQQVTTVAEALDFSALPLEQETQLLISVTAATFKFDDPIFISFSLLQTLKDQNKDLKTVSEEFKILVPGTLDKPLSAIFRDIEKRDWKTNLFLVARVYRYGGQQVEKKKGKNPAPTKRPLGVGVYELSFNNVQRLMDGATLMENLTIYHCKDENSFHHCHFDLVNHFQEQSKVSPTPLNLQELTMMEKMPEASPVTINLSLFEGVYEEVVEANNDVIPQGVPTVWLMNFMEVTQPSYDRHDIYLHVDGLNIKGLSEGFLKTDSGFQNILCTARLVIEDDKKQAKLVPKGLVQWSSNDGDADVDVYETCVHHHVGAPVWNETIKVHIDPKDINRALVVFLFYHIQSSKLTLETKHLMVPFGISGLRLTNSSGLLFPKPTGETKDAAMKLNVYKYEKDLEHKIFEFSTDPEKKKKLESKSEFRVSAHVVSTKVTNDENCKNLIQWQSTNVPIKEILSKFVFVPPEHQIIFLKESFDALFEILDKKGDEVGVADEVFKVINNMIGNISTKHVAYRQLLDTLISNMKSLNAWKHIKNSLNSLLNRYKLLNFRSDEVNTLADSFKILDSLMLIIITSRSQYEDVEKKKTTFKQEDFDKDVKEYQDSIINIMRKINEILPETTAACLRYTGFILKNMSTLWDSLIQIFSPSDCGRFCSEFLKSIPQPTSKNKSLMESKLNIMTFIARGELIKRNEAREHVFDQILIEMKTHFEEFGKETNKPSEKADREKSREVSYRSLSLCIAIAGNLYSSLAEIVSKDVNSVLKDIFFLSHRAITYCDQAASTLLEEHKLLVDEEKIEKDLLEQEKDESKKKLKKRFIMQIQQNIKMNEKLRADIVTMHIAFLNILNDQIVEFLLTNEVKETLVVENETREETLGFIVDDFYHSITTILQGYNLIPSFWIGYQGFIFNTICKTYELLATWNLLLTCQSKFSLESWNLYFTNFIEFIQIPQLCAEQWPLYKKKKILDSRGDVRNRSVQTLINTWKSLGDHRDDFLPRFVDTTFPLILLKPNDEFFALTLELLYQTFHREFSVSQKISKCEGVLQRNICISDLTQTQVDHFIHKIGELITKENQLGEIGTDFINGLKKLMEYTRDVESVPDTEEDRKVEACIGVMEYFLKHNNFDLYFSYVHKLSQTHANLGNFIEAAYCLLLHSNRLSFSSTTELEKFNNDLPQQIERERKESLYKMAIALFEKGNDMENAIRLCKELQKYYEESTYEYEKLDDLCVKMGSNYKNIMKQKRFFSSYFFVGKYGNGWGSEEGEYIYRGTVLENHVDFAQRLKKVQGNTDAVEVKTKPKDKIEDDKKFIEIYTVLSSNEKEVGNIRQTINMNVHPKISSYGVLNSVRIFAKDRRYDSFRERIGTNKKLPKEYNDYKHLHREIVYSYVEENFPCIKRRQPIKTVEIQTLTPLQNATRDIEDKIRDISSLVITHYKDAKPDSNQMSMALNGVLDAAVNGGIKKYLAAFFSKKFIAKADDKTIADLKRFQTALVEQLDILKEALVVWKKFQSKQGMGLVEHLEKRWKEMEVQIRSITQTPLDPKLISLGPEDEVNSDDEYEKMANSQTIAPKPLVPNLSTSGTTESNPDFKSPRKLSSEIGGGINIFQKGSKDEETSLKTTTPTGSLRGSSNLSLRGSTHLSDGTGTPVEDSAPIERPLSHSTTGSKKRLSIGGIKGDKSPQPVSFAPGTPQPGSTKDLESERRNTGHKKSILGIFNKKE